MKAVFVNLLLGANILMAVPKVVALELASNEGSLRTCDDFDACPEGWSLVASPSLVPCGATCSWGTCCSSDAATEVVMVKGPEPERRLAGNTTVTVTTTTTVYDPSETNATMNATTMTATTTTSVTTSTTYTATLTATGTPTGTATVTGTVTATATGTATTTATGTTTSLESNERKVISGYLTVEVQGDLQAFITDPDVIAAFRESIAERASTPKEWVDVSLAAARRLSQGARLRRLAAVTVTYTITIPADQQGNAISAEDIIASIDGSSSSAFTDVVLAKLSEKGVTSFQVTVTDVSGVTTTVLTITTTTTMTDPQTEDDSFALTRVAFTPAHALALLVAIVSVMS